MTTVCVSGGFDPIHQGHVRLIQGATEYGDVVVILNSDDWLVRKKGYCVMPWEHRAEILEAIRGVVRVERVDDTDDTVCEALLRIHQNIFVNGGDRGPSNTPEMEICEDLGILTVFNVGGEKVASSSEIVGALQ